MPVDHPIEKPALRRLLKAVLTLVADFAPLIAFMAVDHYFSTKAAIAAGLAAAMIEIGYRHFRKEKLGGFFWFSITITFAFGIADLYQDIPFLVRYEAVATNVITGLYFFGSLLFGKPVIQEFAEKMTDEPFTGNRLFYVRFLTGVWVVYFFLKALFYGFVVRLLPYGQALILRMVVGKISLAALILGERVFRPKVIQLIAWLKLFPEPVSIERLKLGSLDP